MTVQAFEESVWLLLLRVRSPAIAHQLWAAVATTTRRSYMRNCKRWFEFCCEHRCPVVAPLDHVLLEFVLACSATQSSGVIKSTFSGIRAVLGMFDLTFVVPVSVERQLQGVRNLAPAV